MLLSGTLTALVFKLATFWPQVSTYPFSLTWSEASRYYYASLFFAPQIYGVSVPPSALHPTRYLMQSIPFIIPELPLWFHRLWQVILWVGFTLITAYTLAKRLSINKERSKLVLIFFLSWTFLFLFQGPVYYHLLVCALIVLWGFDRDKFWKTLGVVIVASLWAGISRLNWFPVPGLLAASLYLLEVRVGKEVADLRSLSRYLQQPVAFFLVGTLTALGGQQTVLYTQWRRSQRLDLQFDLGPALVSALTQRDLPAGRPAGCCSGLSPAHLVDRSPVARDQLDPAVGSGKQFARPFCRRRGGERQDRGRQQPAQPGRIFDFAARRRRLCLFWKNPWQRSWRWMQVKPQPFCWG